MATPTATRTPTPPAQKRKKTFSQYCKSIRGQQTIITVLFMILPLLLLFLFTYLPLVKMVQFSLYDMRYIGKRTFVGLQNYIDVFARDDCFAALKLSLYYMVGSVVQMALALLFATILSFPVKGGGIFKGCIFFPYLICGISVGFIFKFFFTRGFVLDSLLGFIGFDLESLPYWLSDTRINNWMLMASSVWRYMGQNMVLFIGAIMSVDASMYEAAEIDGCSPFQKFLYIILPSIKTIVVLNLILSITGALSAFEAPYVITDGAFGTSTYFVLMNRLAHANQKVGLACAMAIVLLGIIVLATLFQKWVASLLDDGDANKCKRALKAYKKSRKQAKQAKG